MSDGVNSRTQHLLRQQLRFWVEQLTTGDTSTLGPQALHAQICSFLDRAHKLDDDDAYVRLLRHFANELEVGIPLLVVDDFLTRALEDKVLSAEDYVELANVRARLLMRREMGEEILELLHDAQVVAQTEYQEALLFNREAVYWELKGVFPKSEAFYQDALALARATDDPRGGTLIAVVLNNLGNWEYAQDHYPEALEYFQQALAQATQVNSTRWRAGAAGGIAMSLTELKAFDEAFEYHELAEHLYRACGNTIGEVRVNLNRSFLATEVGRIAEAKIWAQDALEGSRRLEDAQREASALHNLGRAYAAEKNYEQALQYLHEALRQRIEIGQISFTENSRKAISEVSRAIRQEMSTN